VNGIENRLDHCSVSVSPSLNPDHEQIEVPDDLLRSLSIVGSVSADGADFSGAEMIYNYERLLRQVRPFSRPNFKGNQESISPTAFVQIFLCQKSTNIKCKYQKTAVLIFE
jgi:hypothetical protein